MDTGFPGKLSSLDEQEVLDSIDELHQTLANIFEKNNWMGFLVKILKMQPYIDGSNLPRIRLSELLRKEDFSDLSTARPTIEKLVDHLGSQYVESIEWAKHRETAVGKPSPSRSQCWELMDATDSLFQRKYTKFNEKNVKILERLLNFFRKKQQFLFTDFKTLNKFSKNRRNLRFEWKYQKESDIELVLKYRQREYYYFSNKLFSLQ